MDRVMRRAQVDEIILAIDEASRRDPGGAIAFDGDGTLWSGDVGEDLFHALLAHGLDDASRDALVAEAVAENVDASGAPHEIAHRIHQAYLAGSFPELRICEIMTWAPAGWPRSSLDAFCIELVEKVNLRARLHGEAIRVARHARDVGIEVFVVSASPAAIVEQAARVVGIDPVNVIAAREMRTAADVVGTSVDRPIPYGDGKVTRLRERIGAGRVLYAAFGDNAFDVPLLREARVPVAIRPKARLVARAAEVPGLSVLEQHETP
jgi:phosphoserine phosphatase